MKNPLNKRIPRELKTEWRKYMVIAVVMIFMIGITSGVYVGNNSMMTELSEMYDKYNREDGHFELNKKADEKLINAVETGDLADIKAWMTDKAEEEAYDEVVEAVDEEVTRLVTEEVTSQVTDAVKAQTEGMGLDEDTVNEMITEAVDENLQEALDSAFESDDYTEALDEAWEKAQEEIADKVDEKYDEIVEEYALDEELTEYSATVYELFYKELTEDTDLDGESDGDVRVYKLREDVNQICLMEGEFPSKSGEILIDRMHADNVDLGVGDKVSIGGKEFTITGLGAFSDYSTLHKKNTDIMFDALTFDVVAVTEEDYDSLSARSHYNYAWRYSEQPQTDAEAADMSDALVKALAVQALISDIEIEDYVPAYLSQAINFAPDDMGSDLAMMKVMMVVLIAVLAFIFALTTDSSIDKEASVIGTLRASGYTRGEILRHYMAMPLIVTIIAAIIGNILGYTVFEDICVMAYYNSYSLPTYETLFTPNAFVLTTILPILMMLVINVLMISGKLRLSPLRFLRHDLKRRKKKNAMKLPSWSFLARFRLRIFFQNISDYVALMFGLIFVAVLLSMCIGMPVTLKNYQDNAADMMFAKYQTFLTTTEDEDGSIITTDTEDAEKFASTELLYTTSTFEEAVTVYGVEEGSGYISIPDTNSGEVYLSSAFTSKYGLGTGDSIELSDRYSDAAYTLSVASTFEYDGAIAVFMNIADYRDLFDKDEDYFSGYFSNTEITDINEDYIATVVTVDDILAAAKQLDHSMGSMMDVFSYVCAIIAAAFIYLLTKVIIEKNENSISMIKILGFKNSEISSLYMVTTTIVVIIGDILAVWLGNWLMTYVWDAMIQRMSGYFAFITTFAGNLKMFVLILAAYLLITIVDFKRIKKIPMTEALKNVE